MHGMQLIAELLFACQPPLPPAPASVPAAR